MEIEMNIISWVIFGVVVGLLAYVFSTKEYEKNMWASLSLGVSGALLGGFLAKVLFGIGLTGFSLPSFMIAMSASLVMLFASKLLIKI